MGTILDIAQLSRVRKIRVGQRRWGEKRGAKTHMVKRRLNKIERGQQRVATGEERRDEQDRLRRKR